jgi:hypothetical protein
MLEIYAGSNALKTIQEHGFKQELFANFLGASGGPKWFVLYGLDKYIFGEFFKNRTEPLNLIGSSAGAFRAACFAQHNPVAALERLAKNYSHTVYSEKPTPKEITDKARILLDSLFGSTGGQEIIENPIFKAHFIVAKANGLVASESKFIQILGLLKSLLANKINRGLLKKQYQRFIFQVANSQLTVSDPAGFSTIRQTLTSENIKDALLASGSIPLVMQGIKDISGSPKGMYRDGGIIDYHFDLNFHENDPESGLTLYPHFSASLKAGWFDKNAARKVDIKNYDKTVLICPSKQFVKSLPFQKIPDRTDFSEMGSAERIQYWQQVFVETEQLAQAFKTFVNEQKITDIKNIEEII